MEQDYCTTGPIFQIKAEEFGKLLNVSEYSRDAMWLHIQKSTH